MMKYFDVPPDEYEPVQRQHDMDRADAGPKAPYWRIRYKGVQVESRYAVLEEFNTMCRMIDAIPELAARRIKVIFCDSKATHTYTVTIGHHVWAQKIGNLLHQAAMTVSGGHNGIWVRVRGDVGDPVCDISAEWYFDDAIEP